MQQATTASDPTLSAINAATKSPQVVTAAAAVKAAIALAKTGRATSPGQLSIAPWLGSPNGTTEEFLFIQSLDAGGRRNARITSLDATLFDARVTYSETLVTVYVQVLSQLAKLTAANRKYEYSLQVEQNLAMSLKLIEAQVTAGTKPGSDLELARANWNEARIASQMASENLATIQSSLSAFGLDTSTLDSSSITNAIPSRLNLVETDLLEQRAAATITKLSAERRMASASAQADISMVLRSQNFTRNFTPNDRGFAVQLSIPIDHGSIRSSVATIESQISSIEMRMKDDRSKQNARRKSIETTIASIETAIANTQQSVITPMTDYVAKMKRAYTAGTVTVTAYLDAQRSLHESIHKLMTLRDQRDQLNVQLIEQGGMLPKLLVIHNKQSDRK